MEVEKELNEIREARPTPLAKRWKPKQYQKVDMTKSVMLASNFHLQPTERSKSAHVLLGVKLADDSSVVETKNYARVGTCQESKNGIFGSN